MEKHAYLIVAHNNFNVLQHLILALDDKRNDIYLHIDKKVKCHPKIVTRYSNLKILTNPVEVNWGGYSLIQAEMLLFESAYKSQGTVQYSYYHLLSGVDYPLKTQDYIHDFFSQNSGKEFIGFFCGDISRELLQKVQVYVPFESLFRSARFSILRRIIVYLQVIFGGVRNKDITLKKGANWVSVTNDFVKYLLSQKKNIKKRFRNTFCGDEVYKQTICWNSPYKNRLYCVNDEYKGCMREINWQHTSRYAYLPSYTTLDYKKLKKSNALFARKFDDDNIDVLLRLEKDIL